MMGKNILLITAGHEESAALNRLLGTFHSVQTMCITDPAAQVGTRVDVIVSDITLISPEIIHRLRNIVNPFLAKKTPLLCLVNEGALFVKDSPSDHPSLQPPRVLVSAIERNHLAEVQAKAIGASAVLPAMASARLLDVTLRRVFDVSTRGKRLEQSTSLEAEAAKVGLAIADIMSAAMRGELVTAIAVAEASDVMLNAIAVTGIQGWLKAISIVNDQTYRHCMMVGGLVAAFALKLGFNRRDVDRMAQAALLVDVGKALIPPRILNKQGPLTDEEAAIMRTHAQLGYDLLLVQNEFSAMTLDVVRHHHEYLDASGYPTGLHADEIPDHVRIITLCDMFATLTEQGSDCPPLSEDEACQLMASMGQKLDLHLLKAFRKIFVENVEKAA